MDTANKWGDKVIESFSVQMFYLKLVYCSRVSAMFSKRWYIKNVKTWSPDRNVN